MGCVLVPKLLNSGYHVIVYDLMLFGSEGLPSHPHLQVIKGDLRDTRRFSSALVEGDAFIHLACISNDPSFELNPDLSRTINYDCFEPMVAACRDAGIRRFIYASTSSVYGVSEAPDVTEDHPLVPLTDYNKYKGLCEPILLRYQTPDFTTVIVRPATICGYSPRMRFDLSVNILTNHAVRKRKITIFGGSQKRPNIHIDDIAELYIQLLELPDHQIAGEIFNAAYQNHKISELAEIVKRVVEREMPDGGPIDLETVPSNDLRSYHVSSRKIAEKLGYRPKRTIEDAVVDICNAFKDGRFSNSLDEAKYFNVRTVKEAGLA